MRRGQATLLLLALGAPIALLAVIGIGLLGVRVRAERAQRLADVAALRAILHQAPAPAGDAVVTVVHSSSGVRADVRLRAWRLDLPLVGAVVITPRATASARGITTVDGEPGAILTR